MSFVGEGASTSVVKIPVFRVSGRVMIVLRILIRASIVISSRTVRPDGSRNWVVKVEGASSLLAVSALAEIRVAHLDIHWLIVDKGNGHTHMLGICGRIQ
jgi:hypothetical protein